MEVLLDLENQTLHCSWIGTDFESLNNIPTLATRVVTPLLNLAVKNFSLRLDAENTSISSADLPASPASEQFTEMNEQCMTAPESIDALQWHHIQA